MYNKLLYHRKLEHKTPINTFLKYVVLMKDCSIVAFFQKEVGGGYYEVWDIESKTPTITQQYLDSVQYMMNPFEYNSEIIGFFKEDSLHLYLLKFNDGICQETKLQLPSQKLRDAILDEINEDFRPTYLRNVMQYLFLPESQQLIIQEVLSQYKNEDGTPTQIYVSCWQEDNQCDELTIETNSRLMCSQISPKVVVFYQQLFSNKPFEFHMWNLDTQNYKKIEINELRNIYCTILSCVQFEDNLVVKEEITNPTFYQLLFVGNLNNLPKQILLFLWLDEFFKVINHKAEFREVDNTVFMEVPWIMGTDLIAQCYTSEYSNSICLYDIKKSQLQLLFAIKHEQRTSDLYFSRDAKHFLEVYQDEKQKLREQDMDIKLAEQTEEVLQFHHYTFIPYSIVIFHFIYKNKIVNLYNDENTMEIIYMLFDDQKQVQKYEGPQQ